MLTRTRHVQEFALASGETVELEAIFEPVSHIDPTIVETPHHVIMGYLVHDDDCENPLTSCDGSGCIYHHPRSRYGRREDNHLYYEALGLDSDGEPIIDEDKLQAIWRDRVMALPLELFALAGGVVADPTQLRDDLMTEDIVGDYVIEEQCRHAWSYYALPEDTLPAMIEAIEIALEWSYEVAASLCRKPGNPDTVLLDLYEHGNCVWSIAGGGTQCRWDTSHGESVWVPDDCDLEEIERRAQVYDYAWIEDTNWLRGTGKAYLLHHGDNKGTFSDDWGALWRIAEQIVEMMREVGPIKPQYDGREKARLELCQNALDQYNAWSAGDCYGVVVQVHGKGGELVSEDACWGYVGGDYAEEELAEQIKCAVDSDKPTPNPDQLELAI